MAPPRRRTAAVIRKRRCAIGRTGFAAWRKERKDVLVYFDNDEKGYAAADALRVAGVGEGVGPVWGAGPL